MEVYVLLRDDFEDVSFKGVFTTLEGAKSAIPEEEVVFTDPDDYHRVGGLVIRAAGYNYYINVHGERYSVPHNYHIEKHTIQP